MNDHIAYSSIEKHLFETVPGFREFFFSVYEVSDLEEKYSVMWSFADFFREKWISADFLINEEGVRILQVVAAILDCDDPRLNELVCIWFVEPLITADADSMGRLRSCMPREKMKDCLDELFQFYYRRQLSEREPRTRNAIVRTLLSFGNDWPVAAKELEGYGWDFDWVPESLSVSQFLSVLENSTLESRMDELEDWANAVESREDVGFENNKVQEAVFELANPVLHHENDKRKIDRLIKAVSKSTTEESD